MYVFKCATLYRAPDPYLIHVYHNVSCDPNLARDQLRMCHSSLENNLRSSVDGALALETIGILDQL